MATDARIATGLPRHPKMQKLIRRLGQAAAWNWVCLVLWAAESRTDGDLRGLTDEDIELAADWDGEEGVFVAALVAVKFLDGTPGAYILHDWTDHNPWAAGADKRSQKAKWNAVKRHHGIEEADREVPEYAAIRTKGDATSKINDATSTDVAKGGVASCQKSDAPSQYPSPYPSPSPNVKKKTVTPAADLLPGFVRFWAAWPKNDRKGSRGQCHAAWVKVGAEECAAQVIAHVERMKRSVLWTKDHGAFVPMPTTYVNQKRWEGADEGASVEGWWNSSGFGNRFEAENAGCYAHNASEFRDGKRMEAA